MGVFVLKNVDSPLKKIGIPTVKINICQRFKYKKNVLTAVFFLVFETLKNMDFL